MSGLVFSMQFSWQSSYGCRKYLTGLIEVLHHWIPYEQKIHKVLGNKCL